MADSFYLDLPADLQFAAERAAASVGIDLKSFIIQAIEQKLAALESETFFRERAARGSAGGLLKFLNEAPDQPPLYETDKLPDDK